MTEEQEWASLLAEVFDKLTAKHAAISYKFDKLELSGMVDRNGKKVSTGTVSAIRWLDNNNKINWIGN